MGVVIFQKKTFYLYKQEGGQIQLKDYSHLVNQCCRQSMFYDFDTQSYLIVPLTPHTENVSEIGLLRDIRKDDLDIIFSSFCADYFMEQCSIIY